MDFWRFCRAGSGTRRQGLHSVVSYTVAQRTSEFGIRMALGARRELAANRVQVGVGRRGRLNIRRCRPALTLNHPHGDAGTREYARPGHSRGRNDPCWALVSGLACAIPARRAAKVDPMIALRSE